MATAEILETATAEDPDLPLAAAMIEVLLADHTQVVALVKKALDGNPSKDDRRDLLSRMTALQTKEDILLKALTALDDAGREIPTPSDESVQALADLSGQVEKATNEGLAASQTIGLAAQFVTLAAGVLTELKLNT